MKSKIWTKALFSSSDCIKCQNYKSLTTQSQHWGAGPEQTIPVRKDKLYLCCQACQLFQPWQGGWQRKSVISGSWWQGIFFFFENSELHSLCFTFVYISPHFFLPHTLNHDMSDEHDWSTWLRLSKRNTRWRAAKACFQPNSHRPSSWVHISLFPVCTSLTGCNTKLLRCPSCFLHSHLCGSALLLFS